MPPRLSAGQAAGPSRHRSKWFDTVPGRAVLDSESERVRAALGERPGHPWLWLSPVPQGVDVPGYGLKLHAGREGWQGAARCALPLPLPSESVATVVIQHVAPAGHRSRPLLAECARVLIPGGHCWLFALNPLSPYRWRWSGTGLTASEPMPWRWRLREAGLIPDPVSQGLGPRWRMDSQEAPQHGLGLRAAYLLRAEKRAVPMTTIRSAVPLRLSDGVPAA